MEFLENLYEIENFGIYLFVVIGILVVLFLVVLFFGRKDQKARTVDTKKEENQNLEPKEEVAFEEKTVPTEVEVPIIEPAVAINGQKEVEPQVFTESVPSSNVVLNSNFMEEEVKEEQPAIQKEREFDFDALADAISKELETIDNHVEEVTAMEEKLPEVKGVSIPKEEEDNFQVFEPVRIEPIVEEVKEEVEIEPEKVVEDVVKPKPVMPTVFSSVYVNREKEEVKPVIPSTPVEQTETVTPIKPTIELPKMVDLPKKVDEPVVVPVIEEEKENNIFSE